MEGLKVIIPDDLSKLEKQIKALEWQIEQDTNVNDMLIHHEALNNLKISLKERDSVMSKPFYHLDEDTTHTIIELYNKAKELNLGNIIFEYYTTPKLKGAAFYLLEYKNHWDLVVRQEGTADIYKIIDGSISYDYSERS